MKFLEMIGGLVLIGGLTAGGVAAGVATERIDNLNERKRKTDDFVETLMGENRSLLHEKDNSKDKMIEDLKTENEILKEKIEVSKKD